MQRLETAINLSACFIRDILIFIVATLVAHSIKFFPSNVIVLLLFTRSVGSNILISSRNSRYSWIVVFWYGKQYIASRSPKNESVAPSQRKQRDLVFSVFRLR